MRFILNRVLLAFILDGTVNVSGRVSLMQATGSGLGDSIANRSYILEAEIQPHGMADDFGREPIPA